MNIVKVTAVVVLSALASGALAAQRTFVRSNGSDLNNCSLTQPCRTFGTALVHTNSGGEIVVLDSAGYGYVSVTKSVSIIAPPGIHAGISVASGNGIDIPTAGIKVILRGLSISGQGGIHGVYVTGDNELTVERCDVGGMTGSGIFLDSVTGTAQIRDVTAHDNGLNGIFFAGAAVGTLENVRLERNGLAGLSIFDGSRVSVKSSVIARNLRGIDVGNFNSGVTTSVHGSELQISHSGQRGILATASAGDTRVRLMNSIVDFNAAAGIALLSTGTDGDVRATLVGNTFGGNGQYSIYVDQGIGGLADATLGRNAFADPEANARGPNGGTYLSDGANTLEVNTFSNMTDATIKF